MKQETGGHYRPIVYTSLLSNPKKLGKLEVGIDTSLFVVVGLVEIVYMCPVSTEGALTFMAVSFSSSSGESQCSRTEGWAYSPSYIVWPLLVSRGVKSQPRMTEAIIDTSLKAVAGPVQAVAMLLVSVAGILVPPGSALVLFMVMSFSTSSHQSNCWRTRRNAFSSS